MIYNPVAGNSLNSMTPDEYFAALIKLVMNVFFIFAFVFFFFRIVMGGIAWINSSGEKAKLEQARQQVINSVIGVIVVLSSYLILRFIGTLFGVDLGVFDISSLRL